MKATCPHCKTDNDFVPYVDDVERNCTRHDLIERCCKCKEPFVVRRDYTVTQCTMKLLNN